MLSKKELFYVNTPIEQTPFPGVNYALEAAEKLLTAYNSYKASYQDKEYDIIMSNGDSISLEIKKKNLAHMLGIDYKRVCDLGMNVVNQDDEVNDFNPPSYQALEYLINRIEEIIDHDSKNTDRFLNYFKVMIKSSILMSFSNFSLFDFGIVNFDKSKYDEYKYRRFSSNSSILLFTPSNEIITPHYVMGLKNDNRDSGLIVETMYASPSIHQFLDNQELVIPTQILITDKKSSELTKLSATSKEKIEILKMYQTILSRNCINANINIMADYESMLVEDTNKLSKNI